MPLALIADRAGHAVLKTYDEPSLPPDQIRVRSLFSAVKHGTEGRGFMHNTLDASDRWDGQLRLHRRGEPLSDVYPKPLGNMCVGIVTEIGCQIRDLQVGDRVMGHLPIRETHTLTTSKVRPVPENVSPQALMYWDPADFALGGIRDGGVRPGDRVAVFGLGAIGQMVAQIARIAGARWIAAIDLIEKRREAAARHGADISKLNYGPSTSGSMSLLKLVGRLRHLTMRYGPQSIMAPLFQRPIMPVRWTGCFYPENGIVTV